MRAWLEYEREQAFRKQAQVLRSLRAAEVGDDLCREIEHLDRQATALVDLVVYLINLRVTQIVLGAERRGAPRTGSADDVVEVGSAAEDEEELRIWSVVITRHQPHEDDVS